MAVAVDAVGTVNAGASPRTWVHTCTGSNRLVIVGYVRKAGVYTPGTTVQSVTYDGVAMTSLGRVQSNNASDGGCELFYLVNPSTTVNASVVATLAGTVSNLIVDSISFTGVDQTTPVGTGVTAFGDDSSGTSPPRATVTGMTSGDMAVDIECYGSALSSATPLGTVRWGLDSDNNSAAGNALAQTFTGTGSLTVGSTPTNHDWWGMVAVRIIQAGGGGPTTVNGTGSADLGAIAGSGSGVATVLGAGTASLDTFSASGAGSATVVGSGTAPLGQLVATGGRGTTVTGSGSASLGAITASGTGVVTVLGGGTAPLGTLAGSGLGSGTTTVTGSGSATFGLSASGGGAAEVLGGGLAALGGLVAQLDQVLLFSPTQRRQVTMMAGSLRYSYMVSFTTWQDANGVWRSQETPPNDALVSAQRLLAVSGRPQIVDDQTANELRAAGVGTVEPVARVNASQWI